MSIQLGFLIADILQDHFGDIVKTVGSDLFRFGSKPIALIAKTTSLPRSHILQSLRVLIKFGLVTFEPSKSGLSAEYRLQKNNVLALLRLPKYLLLIKNRYGTEAEMIVEEILQEGSIAISNLIVSIVLKCKEDKSKKAVTVISVRDIIISLVTAGYVQRAPAPTEESAETEVPRMEVPDGPPLPEVNLQSLTKAASGDTTVEIKDADLWQLNFDRFHQDLKDELFITAMTRSIDECAGELMRHLLQQMYARTDPWASVSTPIPLIEIKDSCKRCAPEYQSLNQYLEQYLAVMDESGNGMIGVCGGAGGGQYILRAAHACQLLLWDLLYATVQERLGTKAARIFRLIKTMKYIEEEDIQKKAMLPAKEAKQLTYKLMEENFIDIQVLRKAASSGAGPSKAFYLYHINLNQVAHMVLEMTYKALYNCMTRKEHERFSNKRMIEKQQRVDTIVHGMRIRGEPEENIQDIEETVTPPEKIVLERIKAMIKKLSSAEIQLDETLFILQMYFIYCDNKK